MGKRNKLVRSENKKGFLESLSDFMSDSEELTRKDLLAELEDEGINTVQLMQNVKKIVENGSAKRRLAWRGAAKEKRFELENLLESESKKIGQKASDMWDKARKILKGGYGLEAQQYAEAYFRKTETISEKDLESLIEDMVDLNLLEKLSEIKD